MTLHLDVRNRQAIECFNTLEDRFREIHNDKYDYSKSIYKGSKVKIEVRCKTHGTIFWIKPNHHLEGKTGCTKCISERTLEARTTEFLVKATKVHPHYDYSKVIYKTSIEKVIIICPEHGEFKIRPDHLVRGQRCTKCVNKDLGVLNIIPFSIFEHRAKEVHGDRYDYIEESYKGTSKKVDILCKLHGIFTQPASDHLWGHGCPHCANRLKHKKYHKDRTLLYYIKFILEDTHYFKIGITKQSISRRYNNLSKYPHIKGYEIIASKEFTNGYSAYTLEQEIVSSFKQYLTKDSILIGNGNSEVFDKDIYPDIQHHFAL